MVEAAFCACVIRLANGEEVWRQAASHHLPGVYKDVRRKQAKRKHTCKGKTPAHSFSLAAPNQDTSNTAKQIRDSWKHMCRSTVGRTFFFPPWIFSLVLLTHPTEQIYSSDQRKQDRQESCTKKSHYKKSCFSPFFIYFF